MGIRQLGKTCACEMVREGSDGECRRGDGVAVVIVVAVAGAVVFVRDRSARHAAGMAHVHTHGRRRSDAKRDDQPFEGPFGAA